MSIDGYSYSNIFSLRSFHLNWLYLLSQVVNLSWAVG